MAKFEKKEQARILRVRGRSIKSIAKELEVSRSSVSIWCRDIALTVEQIENLRQSMIKGTYAGRMKGAQSNRERKEKNIQQGKEWGLTYIQSFSNRDLMMLGLGLFLGEGSKRFNRFQFTNSNAGIVKLCILWLKRCFHVKTDDFIFNVFVNKIHRGRDEEIIQYWRGVTEAERDQFRKTVFIKAKNKKVYSNFYEHFGTLRLGVRRSSGLQYKILGLCCGVQERVGITPT
ncbi:MAG: hypothetical protein Q8P01_02395 [bacterium]|nr:hypothetical protein [bacterium]